MKLKKETEDALVDSIKRFFATELEEDIGDLKAALVLEFALAEIAPAAYNQAVVDAQTYVTDKVGDLTGVLFEPEGTYWKNR